MQKNIVIKNADINQIFDISKVLAKSWKSAYKNIVNDEYLSSLQDNHWVDFLENSLRDGSKNCVVAESDSKIIGAAIFGKSITEECPDDGEVIAIYLLPDFTGRGFGRLLFDEAEKNLKKQSFKNCVICVFSENYNAIKFYESLGFANISQGNKITFGTQELLFNIMRKPL